MNRSSRLAILAGVRTPQVKAFGVLSNWSAVDLGRHVVQALLKNSDRTTDKVDEVIFGNVAGPPDAANVARVISLQAGIADDRIAHTVNRNCASGMEAILSGWQSIVEGRARCVVAGGVESMSNIPMLARNSLKTKLLEIARAKSIWQRLKAYGRLRPRDFSPIPGIQLGLTDPHSGLNMGQTAEVLAREFGISRDDQDAFAVESHRRACQAAERCFHSGEIAPLTARTGQEIRLDIGPRPEQSMHQLAKLQPIFEPNNGSVTAGNSCPLTDGAVALLLGDRAAIENSSTTPLGYVSAYAIAGCDPKRMGLGPVFATAKLCQQTGLSLSDFDLVELNEAFAAQVLACQRAFGSDKFALEHLGRGHALGEIDPERLNVNGGGIALGHPVGATGARLILTLLRSLKARNLHRGLATLCVGGGQGVAMVVETV